MAAAREGRAATAAEHRPRRPIGWRAVTLLFAILTGATASGSSEGRLPPPQASTTCSGHDTDEPLRIVSLIPAVTSTIESLGLTPCLVGRALDDRTSSAADVPAVGTVLRPDAERVLAAEPTVVFAGPEAFQGRLASVLPPGLVVTVRFERLDDVVAGVRLVGVRIGRALEGRRLADSIEAGLDRVRERSARPTASTRRVDVLWAVGLVPPLAGGPGGLPDDLIALVGGRNVFADAPAPWFRPSPEQLVARASSADILVWPIGGDLPPPESVHPDSPWHRLLQETALRVVEVDAELVHEAGPQLARAAALLQRQFEQPGTKAVPSLPSPTDFKREN